MIIYHHYDTPSQYLYKYEHNLEFISPQFFYTLLKLYCRIQELVKAFLNHQTLSQYY